MRIKDSIQKNVTKARNELRKVYVEEIINLMKLIGADRCEDVTFNKPIMVVDMEKSTSSLEMNFNMHTVVIDRVAFYTNKIDEPYLMMCYDSEAVMSSIFASLNTLEAVYNAMREVVRKY